MFKRAFSKRNGLMRMDSMDEDDTDYGNALKPITKTNPKKVKKEDPLSIPEMSAKQLQEINEMNTRIKEQEAKQKSKEYDQEYVQQGKKESIDDEDSDDLVESKKKPNMNEGLIEESYEKPELFKSTSRAGLVGADSGYEQSGKQKKNKKRFFKPRKSSGKAKQPNMIARF